MITALNVKKKGIEHKISPILYSDKHWSKDTTESFCKKVIDKYGDKYLLDKVEYKKANIPVLIGCKEHGYFSIEIIFIFFRKNMK